jgi:hypothetical protein
MGEPDAPTLAALEPPAVEAPDTVAELVELGDAPWLPEAALWLAAVF